jgi:hypothetical protein
MHQKEREKGRATGANRKALGIRQGRDIRNEAVKPTPEEYADHTREKVVVEEEKDVRMTETAGQTEMGASTSND